MMRRELYPKDWKELSKEIKERARWRCECCGAPHDLLGEWNAETGLWYTWELQPVYGKIVRCVLTGCTLRRQD